MDDSNNQPDFGPFAPQKPIFDDPFKSYMASQPAAGKTKKAPAKKKDRPKKAKVVKAALSPAEQGKTAADIVKVKRPRKVRAVKIDLALAMSALARLTEEDSDFVQKVVVAMALFPLGRRRRIAAALGKLFV